MDRPLVPPGPPERNGVVDSLRYYYAFLTNSIGTVGERFATYGDIYYAPSNGVGLYVVKHPDHIHDVLVKHNADYGKTHTAFEQLVKFLGHGLLTTDGDRWRRQRRLVNPAFGKKRLAGYAHAMADEAHRSVDRWWPGQVRDMSREMMELTLRVVCRTLFNHDVESEADTVSVAMESFRRAVFQPGFIPAWMPFPGKVDAQRAVDDLDRIIFGMIADRRDGRTESPDPPDLLSLLLAAADEDDGTGLDDREIRDQLLTLFLAGHETTSHALTWTLYLLSQHPREEAKLHEEIDRVLDGRLPTYDDLEHLPYTRWCFEEAMRIYPPAFTLARRAERPTTIGDYAVPAGSEVVVWIYHAHRDPTFWPQPERFRPERFSPEESADRPKLAYLPFGAGARACIGKVFALVEGQLLLAALAQRFRYRLEPGFEVALQPRVTLSPKNGMRMMIERR